MRAQTFLTTLFVAITLAGCVQPPSTPSPGSDFGYDERDSIPNDVPLPKPGVNQRPVVGTKTLLVTVTRWRDGDGLNFPLIRQHTVSTDPDALPAYIRAASHGKLTLAGQIVEHTSGPRPDLCKLKPGDPAPMPISLADAEGKEAAKAHGLNPDSFDYRISVIDCGGNGSAWTPGRFVGVYGQSGGPHIYKHEFGHSLGYRHGSTYIQCPKVGDTVSAPTGCTTKTYGDTGDSVSGGGTLYPANNRWYSGWLDDSQVAVIKKSGLYGLGNLGGEGPQLYLIDRPGLTPSQIALEKRTPTPFDNFPPDDNRVTATWVRYTTMGGTLINTQLDATPETATTADPTLGSNMIFKDEAAKISIRGCSRGRGPAAFTVALNGEAPPGCTQKLPFDIRTPREGAPASQNPVVFSGTSAPGAQIVVSYRKVGGSYIDLNGIADINGNWQIELPPLAAGEYNSRVIQLISANFPMLYRDFSVAP